MDKKIKILYFENTTTLGGGQIGLADLLYGIDKHRFSLYVVLPQKSGPLFERIHRIDGVKIIELSYDKMPFNLNSRAYLPIINIWGIKKIKRILRSISPDIVHANHIYAGKYAPVVARDMGIPSLTTIRAVYYKKKLNLSRFVDKRLFRNSNYLIFNSYTGRDIFTKRTNAKNVLAIRNGLRLQENSNDEKKTNIFKDFNLADTTTILLTVGTLSKSKGHFLLLEALKKLINKNYSIHLFIVGDEKPGSGDKNRLKKLANELGIEKNITFTGFLDNISSFYNAAKCFIFPSLVHEGLPRSIIESMGSGTPVVASNTCGIPELVQNDITGYLFNANDINNLVDKIEKMLNLPAHEYSKMSEINKEIAYKEFAFSSMISKYMELYQNIVNAHLKRHA